jgi:hypothetical protein
LTNEQKDKNMGPFNSPRRNALDRLNPSFIAFAWEF